MKGLAMFFFLICILFTKILIFVNQNHTMHLQSIGSHLYSFVYKNTVQCCHNLGLKARNVKM